MNMNVKTKKHKVNIKSILGRVGETIKSEKNVDIAKALNVQPQVSNNWKKRGTIPLEVLYSYCLKNKIPFAWILTGEDDSDPDPQKDALADFSLVPKYRARLSGGPGAYAWTQDVESHLSFKNAWLNGKCNKDAAALFEVRGDSMSPLITDGDIVLVDTSKNVPGDLVEGKIYAFSEGDRVKVKRLMWRGADLWAISENKTESPDAPVDRDGFNLIGKVIWVGHEVR